MSKENKKPFYKKWWFLLLVFCFVVYLFSDSSSESSNSTQDTDKIEQTETSEKSTSTSKETYEWAIDYDREIGTNILNSDEDSTGSIYDPTRPRHPLFTTTLDYANTLKVGDKYDEIDLPLLEPESDTETYLENWDAYSRDIFWRVDPSSEYYYQEFNLVFERKTPDDDWELVEWSGVNLE